MARISNSVSVVVLLGGVLLVLNQLGLAMLRDDNLPGFVAVALAEGIVYLGAVWVVCRMQPKRAVLIAVLAVATLLRASIVFAPPYLSDDTYRYIWDGRVQAAGINPYRFVPSDRRLEGLRDAAIYPHINRRDYAPTIYPPLAQTIFLGVTRISESVTAMKLAMVGFEAIAMWFIIRLLAAWRLPPQRVLIYAWHPLAIWEIAGSGHVEAVLVALIAMALWLRARYLPALTGVALAGAALIKFFPALLLAGMYRRWDWKMPVAFAGTFLLAYAPYARVGWSAIGFLPGYLREEGLVHGWGIFPLSLANRVLGISEVSGRTYMTVAAAALAAISLYVVLRRTPTSDDRYVTDSLILMLVCTVLLSPHYAWYFLWIVPLLCIRVHVPALYLTLASFLLYELLLHTSEPVVFRIGAFLYLPFAALVVICWFVHRPGRARAEAQEFLAEESPDATCLSK